MIRVTIELVPRGIEALKETLHVGSIWNDATGTSTIGNYGFAFSRRGKQFGRAWRSGRLTGFQRTRLTAWHLLHRALQEAVENQSNEEIPPNPEDAPTCEEIVSPQCCEESAAAQAQQTEADLEEKDRLASPIPGAEEEPGRNPVLLALQLGDRYRQKCELASHKRQANP